MIRVWNGDAVEQELEGVLPKTAKSHNVFDKANVPAGGVRTKVFEWTLAPNEEFYLQTVTGWGDTSAVWEIEIDGAFVGGGRTSTADITLLLDYGRGFRKVLGGKKIEVFVEQYTDKVFEMKVNLGGGLVTGN